MKNNSFKSDEIPLTWNKSLLTMPVVAALCLIGFATAAFAQAKPASQAVKPAGTVLPTPSPTPTPPPRPGGGAQAAQPAKPPKPVGVPAVESGSPGAANAGIKPAALAGDVNQMTNQQFRALPSTAMINYDGKSMTKASFIEQRRKELRAHAKSSQTRADVKFQGAKAQFEQKQKLDLAARNARVKAAAESYDRRMKQLSTSPAYSALAKEANDIVRRYPSAPPSEQAKLKQRAAELHSQLQEMEQNAATGH